jgi:hypothetical protein
LRAVTLRCEESDEAGNPNCVNTLEVNLMLTQQRSCGVGMLLASVIALSFISGGCSNKGNRLVEASPAYQPSPASPQIKIPNVAPAKLADVQEAVRRVFKDAAVIDSTFNPNFLTGDFNGDSSQDLAVILKPAPNKLAEMNEEYPSWLLRDPLLIGNQQRPTLSVEGRDVLLAIIHGYGENDWRDSQATQTYLLKNVVGSNLSVRSAKEFQSAHTGRRLPRPQGDLIQETLRGADGYLYYASATYSWYDPRTFRPKADVGMVHGGR